MSEPSSEPRFGAGTCLIAGICLLLAIPAPDAALGLGGIYLIFRGYQWWTESSDGPLDDGEIRLMQVGEDGEPDRPIRISDLSQPEPEAAEKD